MSEVWPLLHNVGNPFQDTIALFSLKKNGCLGVGLEQKCLGVGLEWISLTWEFLWWQPSCRASLPGVLWSAALYWDTQMWSHYRGGSGLLHLVQGGTGSTIMCWTSFKDKENRKTVKYLITKCIYRSQLMSSYRHLSMMTSVKLTVMCCRNRLRH